MSILPTISGQVVNNTLFTQVSQGMYQFIFFTHKMIINNRRWRKMLESDLFGERLKAFVVDEALCVKKW